MESAHRRYAAESGAKRQRHQRAKEENQKLKRADCRAEKVSAANLQLDDKQRTIIGAVVYVWRRVLGIAVSWCCRT